MCNKEAGYQIYVPSLLTSVFLQVLFRSVNKLLMDTSTSEYLFCIDFFQEDSIYHELIAPTLSVIEAALAAQLQVSFQPNSPHKQ